MSEGVDVSILYDKDCPFCHLYHQNLRLEDTLDSVTIINAREPSDLLTEVTELGLDVDEGMVVKVNNVIYNGADALHVISSFSSKSTLFNRLNYYMFRSKGVTKMIYPYLRSCRSLALWLMYKSKIKNLKEIK